MGVLYCVMPLREMLEKQEGREWLAEGGLHFDAPPLEGRYPTLSEVLTAAYAMEGCKVEHNGNSESWSVYITGNVDDDPCYAAVHGHTGNEEGQYDFYMKGYPHSIVWYLSHLSRFCGHFLVILDATMEVIVVTPETLPDAEWHEGW
jgi:hypothetical protein